AVQAKVAAARAEAALASAKTAPEQVQGTKARAAAAEERVQHARAGVSQAQLNLDRTVIKAPSSGIVGKRSIEVGQQVQAGPLLCARVSRDQLWVIANFKETQLAKMRAGQSADVEVDALGGQSFRGKVD